MNVEMKIVLGSAIDLAMLSIGMVVGGFIPIVGSMSGPVYAGVLLVIGECIQAGMGI